MEAYDNPQDYELVKQMFFLATCILKEAEEGELINNDSDESYSKEIDDKMDS